MSIGERLACVRERMERAAQRSGRDLDEIVLVAVTKTVSLPDIEEAVSEGIRVIGENRIQELEAKYPRIAGDVEKHFVGHLQRNKVNRCLELVDVIESLDSLRLARSVEKRARRRGRRARVLIQVNVAGEETKYGIPPEEIEEFAARVQDLSGLKVEGLMTIAPFTEDPEETRPFFRRMRELFDGLREDRELHESMRFLSMGMTNDFEVAIEEGSNMVRLGTAIFGPRS